MADLDQLLNDAQRRARIPGRDRALCWLRATCSTLDDWASAEGGRVLRECLPAKLFRGSASRGRSWKKAVAESGGEGGGGEDAAFPAELASRAIEMDPGKVATTLLSLLGILKEQLAPEQVETVAGSLPAPVAARFRAGGNDAPWAYHLTPQPFGEGRRRSAAH